MKLGTNNKQIKTLIKDYIKQLLFVFSFNKPNKKKQLDNASSIDDTYKICNDLICVHQSKYEILQLIQKLKQKQPKVIVEIGTADGGTSLLLGRCLTRVDLVICIDLYVKNKKKLTYFLSPKTVHTIDASSYSLGTVEKVHKILNGRTIDFLFIDGDHTYDGVSKDYKSYLNLLSNDGIVGFHDIVPDYLTTFGRNTGMWVGDVPKFWKEIKERNHFCEIIENSKQDGQGIGLLL
ncbi:MAG: class I SAM-dependent methyltransferase [Bacteroidota bacterium]|nr:class I SAM-dependent methyltransferase [Bacteroidota bacterium]